MLIRHKSYELYLENLIKIRRAHIALIDFCEYMWMLWVLYCVEGRLLWIFKIPERNSKKVLKNLYENIGIFSLLSAVIKCEWE